MTHIPQPEPGDLLVCLLLEDRQTIVFGLKADRLDEQLQAIEGARGFEPASRSDRALQIGGRMYAYQELCGPDAADALQTTLGLEIVWLAVNSYAANGEVRGAIDRAIERAGSAVLTVVIGTAAGEPDGTHWAVTVGNKPYSSMNEWGQNAATEAIAIFV